MTTVTTKTRCSSEEMMSCDESASVSATSTADGRAKATAAAAPRLPEGYGRDALALATQVRPAAPPPLSPEDCAKLPEAVLDHQAAALRGRLGKPADYAERLRDAAELKNVEGELQTRQVGKDAAAREAHGGVMLCKRVADLPGKDVHGAEHWWLETTRKSVGMGPATGTVPGHGESMPESLDTKLLDHSQEPRTNCKPVTKAIDEDCVDREMQLGEPTGVWIPGVNDCHTVVKGVIDKCHEESIAKALEADAASRPGNAPVGAR